MKSRIVWPDPVRDAFLELLPLDQAAIQAKLDRVERFAYMYQAQQTGRFRRHRKFVGGNWGVYYRVIDREVFVRAIWAARMPLEVLDY
ncbi:MAG: hypothetical protein ACRD5F_16275 [Candidatus Acidiferrales bacterium]